MYQWRKSFLKFNSNETDPNAAAQVLGRLEESEGHVTAQSVIKAAEPKSSPIHKAFEWDDSIAAEQYRIEQARSLIKSIEIIEASGSDTVATPIYFHVPQSPVAESYYKSRDVLIQDVDEWQRAVGAARSQVAGCIRLLNSIEDLCDAPIARRSIKQAARSLRTAQTQLEKVV